MRSKLVIFIVVFMCFEAAFASSIQTPHVLIFTKLNYYSSEKEATVVCRLQRETEYSSFTIQLSNYQSKRWTSYQFPDSLLRLPVNISTLREGKNQLHFRILKNNTVVKDSTISLVKLRPADNEVKIDQETGGLIVDGLPFFPFGFYCTEVGKIPEQEIVNGFNLIGPYQNNYPAGLTARKAYMDRCAQLGMKVQYGVNSLVGSGHNGEKENNLSEDEKLTLLRKEVITVRNHPALLSWYINDEPDGQGRDPKVLEKAYTLIHELDPYHPVSVVFMMPSKFKEYIHTADIPMTDPYPIPKSVDIRYYLQQLGRDFGTQKSIWLVPQAFGGQEMWPRETTPKEIRVMSYLGLLENAKGIQYFLRSVNNLNPQSVALWSECSNMAVEIQQMTPFLLSTDKQLTISTNNAEVLAKLYGYKGYKLLIVINKSNEPCTFTATIPDAQHYSQALLWFENRTVKPESGQLTDMIDALGTRVYLFRSPADSTLTSSENLIYNAGFEEVTTPGLATGQSKTFRNEQQGDKGATVFTDSRESKEGLFSLRLVTPTDSAGKTVRFLPVILNAGNTYNVSLWAKAKRATNMPHIRIGIPCENAEKVAELSSEWKKYSFMFKATVGTTNAVAELELMQQGTAWIDQMQIVADPIVSYHIVNGDQAVITMQTCSDSSSIVYNTHTGSSYTHYTRPFSVQKADTVKALLYKGDKLLAESSVFVPLHKALGKQVRFITPYDPQYPSAGDKSLTDGIMGSTSFRDKRWLGFLCPEAKFVVDLQQISDFSSVTLHCLSDANSGIFLPRSITIAISDNGTDYRTIAGYTNTQPSRRGEPYLLGLSADCNPQKARFIQVSVNTFGTIPDGYLFKGSTSWLFIDEILIK